MSGETSRLLGEEALGGPSGSGYVTVFSRKLTKQGNAFHMTIHVIILLASGR
jgi:hypothetical protein